MEFWLEMGFCGRSEDSSEGKFGRGQLLKEVLRSERKSAFEGEGVGEENIYRGKRKWDFQFYP